MIKIPINEPAEGKKKSQIQEYLEWHDNTAGIQHLALLTFDAIDSVGQLRKRGVDFLTIPDAYYDQVWDRVGEIREDTDRVKDLQLLADRDDQGYLLQIFTKPLQDRPTLFFEIICRRGSKSFGKGNFQGVIRVVGNRTGQKRKSLMETAPVNPKTESARIGPSMNLSDFFQHLNECGNKIPLEKLRQAMNELELSAEDVAEYLQFGNGRYRRNLVHRTGGYEVLLLCFEPGQRTPIHDHCGSACGVKVVQGTGVENYV